MVVQLEFFEFVLSQDPYQFSFGFAHVVDGE